MRFLSVQLHHPTLLFLHTVTGPILLPSTGHYYELITSPLSFGSAVESALRKTHNGIPGHLATITTRAEYDFIAYMFNSFDEFWIGATDSSVEGTFRWISGPEVGQLMNMVIGAWGDNQPDNWGNSNQDCISVWSQRFWDDDCFSSYHYLVEYEGVLGCVC